MSARIQLSEQQRLNWLRLIRTRNVGPTTFRDLINRFGSAEAALEALPELRQAGGASRPLLIPSKADAEREMATADHFGARFVAIGEPDYPAILQHMDMPPPLLAIKGNAGLFHPPAVAIVGARNASATGARMARMLAAGLGQQGYAIVSGLARGMMLLPMKQVLPRAPLLSWLVASTGFTLPKTQHFLNRSQRKAC